MDNKLHIKSNCSLNDKEVRNIMNFIATCYIEADKIYKKNPDFYNGVKSACSGILEFIEHEYLTEN